MRISDALVEKLLRSANAADNEQLATLRAQETAEKKPLQDLAILGGIVSEEQLTRLYAKEIDVPFTEIPVTAESREIMRQLPERIARQYHAILFGTAQDGSKLVAMEDPDDIQAISFLRKSLGQDIKVYLATSSEIASALDHYRENIDSELTKVISAEPTPEEDIEAISEEDLAEDSPIAQTVSLLIQYAIKANASDIHIEPRENFVVIRYRVDGVLREANKLPKKVLGALVSRIKILSNLKIDERRAPQDGRFKIEVGSQVYALRVATLPIVDGEKVAIRILNESAKPATLEQLGFWGKSLRDIQHAIAQPHGMVLVTGPTGSGKSTSLFSILSLLNKPSINISTIEDPVEYRIAGANQTQINVAAHMTFVAGLRALLRQDPNVIMVGEIRDGETATLAIQAALTGHLVFSTLHTNNAATCLPRLLDMQIEPFLIASTVRAVVGQRLVRKLCENCRKSFPVDDAMQTQLHEVFHTGDRPTMQRIARLEIEAKEGGIGSAINQLSSDSERILNMWGPSEDGCEQCDHTGYKGRIGMYEVLDNSTTVQQLIVKRATSDEIQSKGVEEGMITLQQDGLIKVLRGLTSLEEVLRVTAET